MISKCCLFKSKLKKDSIFAESLFIENFHIHKQLECLLYTSKLHQPKDVV